MDNDTWYKVQEQARKDAEAGRARSTAHTSSSVANDLYNRTYTVSQPPKKP